MSDLTDKPESYAWKPIVMFSASLLVLSVSLNNAGFKSIIDAWSASIVANIKNQCDVPQTDQSVLNAIKTLESDVKLLKTETVSLKLLAHEAG